MIYINAIKMLAACILLALLPGVVFAQAKDVVFLHYWSGPLAGGVKEMAESFNKSQSSIHLLAQEFEHESFKVGIKVMLGSERPPELFSYWAGARVRELADNGWIASVDSVWLDHDLESRFASVVTEACRYNGSFYGVPLTQHYVAVFYNKRIFEQHGLAPPVTWEEFLRLCEVLKANGVTPLALGARNRWPAQFWFDYLLLRTAGHRYRDQLMEGWASYQDSEVRHAFALWKELLDKGYFLPHPEVFDWSESAKQVRNGSAAMMLIGGWVIGLYEGQLGWKQGTDFDFFPFPEIDPEVAQVSVGPIDLVVASKSGSLESAMEAMAFLAGKAPQMAMSTGSGALAPNIGVPPAFYGPLQRRMLAIVHAAPYWAFNYDLAAPPDMAEAGLTAFLKFVEDPQKLDSLLHDLDQKARTVFPREPSDP